MVKSLYFFLYFLICISLVSCGGGDIEKPGVGAGGRGKPGPSPDPGPLALSTPNSKSLNIATLTLDNFGLSKGKEVKDNPVALKTFLNRYFVTHDLLVFYNVVRVREFIEKVAHKKFNCLVYKRPDGIVTYRNMVVCSNPAIKRLKEGVSTVRIDPMSLEQPEIFKPGFQSVYEYADGFKFHLVAIHLKNKSQSYLSRKMQVEKLTEFLVEENSEVPTVIVGHWNNIPEILGQEFNCDPSSGKTESTLMPSELSCHKEALTAYDSTIDMIQGQHRTVIESGRYSGVGLKFNSVAYSSNTWLGIKPTEMSICKKSISSLGEDAKNYLANISSSCLVSFKLKRLSQ